MYDVDPRALYYHRFVTECHGDGPSFCAVTLMISRHLYGNSKAGQGRPIRYASPVEAIPLYKPQKLSKTPRVADAVSLSPW